MSFFKWGSHTADANSICGLTKAAYALSLVCSGHLDRFLLRNASERVALTLVLVRIYPSVLRERFHFTKTNKQTNKETHTANLGIT